MEYGSGGDAVAGALVALWTSMMCLMYLVPMLVAGVSITVWIVSIIDVVQRLPEEFPNARSGREDPNERMLWLLIVVLTGVIGSAVYYFVVMKPYPRRPRSVAVGAPAAPPVEAPVLVSEVPAADSTPPELD